MSRYIDADEFEKYINREEWETPDETWRPEREFGMIIDSIPTADVAEVVRCKDCKWYGIDELKKDGTVDRRYNPSVCYLYRKYHEKTYFCADGERMKQVYDLCELCSLFEPEQCKKGHRLHPLKATVECEDFQMLFEDWYEENDVETRGEHNE